MEHAGASARGGEHGGAVEEVAPEEADAALVASSEREEVVRLGLVICGAQRQPNQHLPSSRCARVAIDSAQMALTGIEDGGVDGVAAVEEAADEARADDATGTGD